MECILSRFQFFSHFPNQITQVQNDLSYFIQRQQEPEHLGRRRAVTL